MHFVKLAHHRLLKVTALDSGEIVTNVGSADRPRYSLTEKSTAENLSPELLFPIVWQAAFNPQKGTQEPINPSFYEPPALRPHCRRVIVIRPANPVKSERNCVLFIVWLKPERARWDASNRHSSRTAVTQGRPGNGTPVPFTAFALESKVSVTMYPGEDGPRT